jgi:hypothetical protein
MQDDKCTDCRDDNVDNVEMIMKRTPLTACNISEVLA